MLKGNFGISGYIGEKGEHILDSCLKAAAKHLQPFAFLVIDKKKYPHCGRHNANKQK
jgi:hypothetical protein